VEDALARFRSAALDFRVAFGGSGDPRRLRNAVARAYLAAAFLPAAAHPASEPPEVDASGHRALRPSPDVDLEQTLEALDAELGRALTLLARGEPADVSRVRLEFEQRWSHHALDALRPLHRLATCR
jgi:hypothetical protein